MDNYKSAFDNRKLVEKQIKEEIIEGRYLVCSEPATIVSALGAIPKAAGGVRLIHDCSRPCGTALNDYASNDNKIKYQTIKDAVHLLTPEGYMAKVDLKSAYRSVALHPSQYEYTGLKWTFEGADRPTHLLDTRLCFGARLSPGIFHRLTQAVCRIMLSRNFKTAAYLDDFILLSNSKAHCQEGLNVLISLLRDLGFAIAWPKVETPTQELIFLGILINSKSMSLHLPEEKVGSFKSLLNLFKTRTRASCRQLQQLAGKLSWAAHVVRGGRIYLQRVLDLMRPLKQPHHKVILNSEFQLDIEWWLNYIDHFNCTYMLRPPGPTVDVYTDACGSGAGMVTHNDWAYVNWQSDMPEILDTHINVKETVAVVAAATRWAPLWTGCHVIVHTDNITTKAAINKGRCTSSLIMCFVRYLFWLSEQYQFSITCIYVPGALNIQADAVSRLTHRGHLLYWLSVLAAGCPYTKSDLGCWLLHHCSSQTAIKIFLQACRTVPWLKSSTKQLQTINV